MVIECEVDDLDNMLRLANVSGFKIMCDEPETIGGNGTAPAPLHYLAASILFGETTQIERYSQLMKVTITKFRAEATVYFDIPGSVLAGTIKAGAPKVETRYEIESPHDPAEVAAMSRIAKNGCWGRAAIANPTPFEETLTLNGKPSVLD